MEALGYIVTRRKLKNMCDYIKTVADYSMIEDHTKPILIVGYSKAKSIIENFSIIEKTPTPLLHWTFDKIENRIDFEHDIDEFCDYAIQYDMERIKYYYINPFSIKYSSCKNLISILKNDDRKYIYIGKGMAYIMHKSFIFGISLTICEMYHIKAESVRKRLKMANNAIIKEGSLNLDYKSRNIVLKDNYKLAYFVSLFDDSN